jgi:hypothetical protein
VYPALNALPSFRLETHAWTPTPQYYHPGRYSYAILAVPHWLILLAFLILPFLSILRLLRSRLRRRRLNLCPTCAYDLRSTPNLCPECGNSPQPSTAASVSPSGVGWTQRS